MALAPLLYNITFDSQTRILYFWDKAGHEIYHCEIPSPAPALPTVSVDGDWAVGNWFYAQPGGTVISISAGESWDLFYATSSGYAKVLFDTSKKYAVLTWYSGKGSGDKGVNGSLSISNTGYIAAKNETNSSLSLYALRCAVCSASDATVITVYDNSNNPYNAFKYTSDGTDYYYVLDGVQTDWTDDLSGIGYHVPPALPTVSRIGNYAVTPHTSMNLSPQQISPWLFTISSYIDQSTYPNSTFAARRGWTSSEGSTVNGSNLSCIWDDTDGGAGIYPVTRLSVKNISSSNITLYTVDTYECSSLSATVITVYDSSNNPYNAFQYTSDGTDYYYVLDGTQTDWTDDLESIGYSDQLLIRGWMKADKSSVTLNAGGWTNWQLLNDSGSILYVDTSKTYTLHSPKSGTMKINKSVSGELYYEGRPSETIIVSDVIISVS